MLFYIENIKTKYSITDVYKELISIMKREEIHEILKQNKLLRLKCNLLKKTDIINPPRKMVEKTILEMININRELKKSINVQWKYEILDAYNHIKNLKVDKINKILNEECNIENLFRYATVLWLSNVDKENLLGDKAYEMYLNKKNKNILKDKWEDKMNREILNISLGDILKIFGEENLKKQDEFEKIIKNNSNEINKLSQQVKVITEFNKDIKPVLNSISEKINTFNSEITSIEKNSKYSIDKLKTNLDEISNKIRSVSSESKNSHEKELKSINNNIKDMGNLIKSQVKVLEKMENDNMLFRRALDNINDKLNNNEVDNAMNTESETNNEIEEQANKGNTYSDDTAVLLNELLSDK